PPLGGGRWQAAAVHVREAHAGLLEHRAVAQHPAAAAAAARTLPRVLPKPGGAVEHFQALADAVLQFLQVVADLLAVDAAHADKVPAGCGKRQPGRITVPVRASMMVVGLCCPPKGPLTTS